MPAIKSIVAAVRNRLTLKANRGPINIGLIGIGGWGGVNAASIMLARRFNIVGVHDIQTDLAAKFARRFHLKYHTHTHDLLNDSSIQAVSITVPNHFHADMVRAVADAGKHVFIEKPLASYPDLCRELGEYCENRRVILQVGHQMRRAPVFREIKRILKDGALGEPLYVQGVYTLDRRTRDDWRCDANACPGGSMEQLGVHLLDVLVYLLGRPLASCGRARNIPRQSAGPDWGSVILTFPDEVKATICTSLSSANHMRLEVFFREGCLATDGKTIHIQYRDGADITYKPHGADGSVSQFVEFADCIEHGNQPETGAEEAAVVMAAVQSMFSDAAYPHRDRTE